MKKLLIGLTLLTSISAYSKNEILLEKKWNRGNKTCVDYTTGYLPTATIRDVNQFSSSVSDSSLLDLERYTFGISSAFYERIAKVQYVSTGEDRVRVRLSQCNEWAEKTDVGVVKSENEIIFEPENLIFEEVVGIRNRTCEVKRVKEQAVSNITLDRFQKNAGRQSHHSLIRDVLGFSQHRDYTKDTYSLQFYKSINPNPGYDSTPFVGYVITECLDHVGDAKMLDDLEIGENDNSDLIEEKEKFRNSTFRINLNRKSPRGYSNYHQSDNSAEKSSCSPKTTFLGGGSVLTVVKEDCTTYKLIGGGAVFSKKRKH